MRIHLLLAAALPILALTALPVRAAVTVTYGDPDKFTDAGDRNTDPRKMVPVLAKYLEALGAKYLPPSANLAIEIIDLDRAGRPRGNLPSDIRIMTGNGDMPCMDVRSTLDGAAPVRERVCDPDYLRPLEFKYAEHDPLVYEKRMLDNWFAQRFGKGAPPR